MAEPGLRRVLQVQVDPEGLVELGHKRRRQVADAPADALDRY